MMDTWYGSSISVEWYTPRYLVDAVIAVLGEIDCDPCSPPPPYPVSAAVHYTVADDGLAQTWRGRVYMNPPYGDALPLWIQKLETERALGHVTAVITLTPARTDTVWFQPLWAADALCFMRGRVKFGNGDGPSPFPTVLAYWGPEVARFVAVFAGQGQIIYPGGPAQRAHQLSFVGAAV